MNSPADTAAQPLRHAVAAPAAPVLPPHALADTSMQLLDAVRAAADCPPGLAAALQPRLWALRAQWQVLWARFAGTGDGWPHYRQLLDAVEHGLGDLRAEWRLADGTAVADALRQRIIDTALDPARAGAGHQRSLAPRHDGSTPSFTAPVFVVGAPRAGTALVTEALARTADAWTTGTGILADLGGGLAPLAAAAHEWRSDRLEASDATPAVIAELHARITGTLRNRDGAAWHEDVAAVRLLDRPARGALRIAFLAAAFPDARFIHVVREPQANVASILEAWRSGRFVTHERLPDWRGGRWSLPLIPGWRDLVGADLATVAATQYAAVLEQALADLATLPATRWCAIGYEQLLLDPAAALQSLATFAGLRWDAPPPTRLPPSATALTAAHPQKWRRNEAALAPHRQRLQAVNARVRAASGLAPAPDLPEPDPAGGSGLDPTPRSGRAAAPKPAVAADPRRAGALREALSSVHTRSFVEVLQRAGISLAVSTYQAGKLVLARADGERVNTGFVSLQKPMGIALSGRHLAVGTAAEVRLFQDAPAAGGERGADACYLPRQTHHTGNIDIHEMAWAGGALWCVNTRFSCLATLDADASFTPRWRPSWVSALAPEDRCHLNGLAVVDGRVRYVTALGRTDTAGGWRANKADGGLLLDLHGERVICDGLSMPHSPRWYRGRLWVLESGTGGLCRVDPQTGMRETVAVLPGFTRGLDFRGPLAFVGLSQVRESAVFSGLPLTERLTERISGVWVVNIDSGETIAFLRFEQAVQEVFAVQVLPHRFPDLLTADDPSIANAFVLPDAALADVPARLRGGHADPTAA